MAAFQNIGVQAVVQGVNKYQSDLRNMETQTKGFGSAVQSHLGGVAAALGGIAAAFGSFQFLKGAVGATQEMGLAVEKLRRETGLSTEDASRLLFAFQHVGLGIDDASRTLGIFAKKLKGVSDEETGVVAGGKSTAEILKDIGVNATDAAGNILPIPEILGPLADKFKVMPDGIEKTGLALQLFGRGGKDIIPLLNLGSEGLAEMSKEADKLGVTLSGENVAAIKKFTFAQRDMKEAIGGLKLQIGLALLPVLTKMIKAFIDAQPAIRRFLITFIQGIKDSAILQDLIRDVQLLFKAFDLLVAIGKDVVIIFGHMVDSITHFRLGGINDDFADFARLLGLGEGGARLFGTVAENAFTLVGRAASTVKQALNGMLDALGPVGRVIREILGPIGDFVRHLSAGALAAQAAALAVGGFLASLVIHQVLSMTGAIVGLAKEMANLLVQLGGLAGKVFTFTVGRIFTGGAEAGANVAAAEAGAAAGQQLQTAALITVDELHALHMTVDSVTQAQIKPSEGDLKKLEGSTAESVGKGVTQGFGAGIGFEIASEFISKILSSSIVIGVWIRALAAVPFAALAAPFILGGILGAIDLIGGNIAGGIAKILGPFIGAGIALAIPAALGLATPPGWVVAIAAAVGLLLALLYDRFQGPINNFFTETLPKGIGKGLGVVGGAIADFFTPANLGRVVGTGLAVLVSILFPPALILKFREQIGTALSGIGGGIITFFTSTLPSLVSSLDLGGLFSTVTGALGTGLSVTLSTAISFATQTLPNLIAQIPRLFAGLVISIPSVLTALPGLIVAAFTDLPGTIVGALSRLGPQLVSFFAGLPITQAVGEFLKGVEESFLGFFNINLGDVGNWISTLAGVLAGLAGAAAGALAGLGGALLGAVGKALESVGSALARFFTIDNLGTLVGEGLGALVAFFVPPTLIIKFRKKIADLAGPILGELGNLALAIIKGLPTLEGRLLLALGKLALIIGKGLLKGLSELPVLIGDALSAIPDNLPSPEKLSLQILSFLGGGLLAGLKGLPSLLSRVFTRILPSLFLTIFEGLPTLEGLLLVAAGKILLALGDALLMGLTELPRIIGGAILAIAEKLPPTIASLELQLITAIGQTLLGAFNTLGPQVLDFFVGLGSSILGAVGDFLSAVERSFLSFFDINAGDINKWIAAVVGFVVGLGVTVVTDVGKFLGEVVQFFIDLPGQVLGALSGFPSLLVASGQALINGLQMGIIFVWNNSIFPFLMNLPGVIVAAIGDLSGLLVGAGRSLMQGFIDGLSGAAGSAGSVVASIINGIIAVINRGLAGIAELVQGAKDLIDALPGGNPAGDTMQAIINALRGGIGYVGGGSTSVGRPVGGRAAEGYQHGGVVPGPRGMAQTAIVHGGEQVLTAGQSDAISSGLAGILSVSIGIRDLVGQMWGSLAAYAANSRDILNAILTTNQLILATNQFAARTLGEIQTWTFNNHEVLMNMLGYADAMWRLAIGATSVEAQLRGARGFASGGVTQESLQFVGERGMELAALPKGTRIFSHRQTMRILENLARSVAAPAPQAVSHFAPALAQLTSLVGAQAAQRGDFTAHITVDTQKEAAREIERTLRRVAFSMGT